MLMLILKFLNNLKGWFAICLVIVDKSRLNCEECTRKKKNIIWQFVSLFVYLRSLLRFILLLK
jgi:hypothetical protein